MIRITLDTDGKRYWVIRETRWGEWEADGPYESFPHAQQSLTQKSNTPRLDRIRQIIQKNIWWCV